MEYKPYSLKRFLTEIEDLDYSEMITQAEAQVRWVESISYGRPGAVEARKQGSPEYAERIKSFLFWLRFGTRPAGIDNEEFALYRPVADALVEKGQLNPEILDLF